MNIMISVLEISHKQIIILIQGKTYQVFLYALDILEMNNTGDMPVVILSILFGKDLHHISESHLSFLYIYSSEPW